MRTIPNFLAVLFAVAAMPWGAGAQSFDWADVTAKARGQEVFWNAWGGDERINAYIAWVGQRVQAEYGVTLRHVKLSDTAEAVRKVLAEKTAGRHEGGSVDLIWINGENFKAMKDQDLLFGPFAEQLPNFALVDVENKPTVRLDFTVPTDGLEAPWGMAKLNFIHDSAMLADPPRSMAAILAHAKAHPGRVAYPAPPDFIGSTFLKQVVYETATDPSVLQQPAGANFDAVTAPMWAFLDELTPHLWRGGKVWPKNGPALIRLLDDGEVDIAISFYPAEASSAIAAGLLPETARSFVLAAGTIGNTHFVAIPYNAKAPEGAMVVANFLMSPEAQARKENPEVWGDNTVLAVDRIDAAGRKLFADLPRGAATLPPEALGRTLPEPHPSWMTRIEEAWLARYGS
ncbi:MAG: ABC transporter substrate-binding protein [Rhodospirillales bacterium]|nr:MAG: ABC transporter substrate-binding protein [Rhodospirillales bacterium]